MLSVKALDCQAALHRPQVIAPSWLFDTRQAALTWPFACGSTVCLVECIIWMSKSTFCFRHKSSTQKMEFTAALTARIFFFIHHVLTHHQGPKMCLICCLQSPPKVQFLHRERSCLSLSETCPVERGDFHWHFQQHKKKRQLPHSMSIITASVLVWRLAWLVSL